MASLRPNGRDARCPSAGCGKDGVVVSLRHEQKETFGCCLPVGLWSGDGFLPDGRCVRGHGVARRAGSVGPHERRARAQLGVHQRPEDGEGNLHARRGHVCAVGPVSRGERQRAFVRGDRGPALRPQQVEAYVPRVPREGAGVRDAGAGQGFRSAQDQGRSIRRALGEDRGAWRGGALQRHVDLGRCALRDEARDASAGYRDALAAARRPHAASGENTAHQRSGAFRGASGEPRHLPRAGHGGASACARGGWHGRAGA